MKRKTIVSYCLLALIMGLISPMGWAPWGIWPALVGIYAALGALLIQTEKPLHAGLLAWLFGAAQQLSAHGWIYTALHIHSGLPAWQAALCSLLGATYLGGFLAAPCYLWARWHAGRQSQSGSLLALAALLTLGEWLRSQAFNGFSSLAPGYALVGSPYSLWLPIGGALGGSLFFYLSSLLTAGAFNRWWRGNALAALVWPLLLLGLPPLLPNLTWSVQDGAPVSYRLLQTNIAQADKFGPSSRAETIRLLGEQLTQTPADIIVTPETAYPMFFGAIPAEHLARLRTFSNTTHSNLFVGVMTGDADRHSFNSLLQIGPQQPLQTFNKIRLMPLGEYAPLGLGWLSARLSIPFKDLRAGAAIQAPFRAGGARIGTLICHEDLVPALSRRWAAETNLFLNPSNLAWFDDSIALPQRLQIVRARALEVGRPILRVANTGITAAIDHRGIVLKQLAPDRSGELSGKIQPMQGLTPFARFGETPVLLLALVCASLSAKRWRHGLLA